MSVLELVNTFEKVNGVKVPYHIAPRREGDIEAIWANSDKATKELHWQAKRTLEETLRSAWKWQLHSMGKEE